MGQTTMTGSGEPTQQLIIPEWLSKFPGIVSFARMLFDHIKQRPLYQLSLLNRLTADPRMKKVWREINKKKPSGEYQYRICMRKIFAHPHYLAVSELLTQGFEEPNLQEQACMLLFSIAFGELAFNERGIQVQTVAELNEKADAFRACGIKLEEAAQTVESVSMLGDAKWLREKAAFYRKQAELHASRTHFVVIDDLRIPNPWVANRKDRRAEDGKVRGYVILLANSCLAIFGNPLLGTITNIANVALAQSLTKDQVRGITKGVRQSAVTVQTYYTTRQANIHC
jgi:hypothetical protein